MSDVSQLRERRRSGVWAWLFRTFAFRLGWCFGALVAHAAEGEVFARWLEPDGGFGNVLGWTELLLAFLHEAAAKGGGEGADVAKVNAVAVLNVSFCYFGGKSQYCLHFRTSESGGSCHLVTERAVVDAFSTCWQCLNDGLSCQLS